MKHSVAALLLVVATAACSQDAGKSPADLGGEDDGDDAALGTDTGHETDAGDVTTDMSAPDLAALDGGPDASAPDMNIPSDDPIEAPSETWTWVEFPDAVCGNGQPTGLGVNLTDRSDDVFVFMMGGGACWDVNSCFVLNAAANIETGYDETRFDNDAVLNAPAFDREDSDNPLRDLNWVFIPYCTGDVHAGDKVTTYMAVGQTRQVHHVGSANVRAYLARLAPTFASAERVFVSGASAGGYGAQLNFHQFAAAFADAEVHVLSDSGPLVQPYGGRLGEWNAAWTLQTPAGCADCPTSFPAWYDHLVTTYPQSRFGLLTYDADQTIHAYFGYPVGNSFTQALVAFTNDHVEPAANAEIFMLGGTQHVLLGGLTTIAAPGGTRLSDWVTQWMEGDDEWASVRP